MSLISALLLGAIVGGSIVIMIFLFANSTGSSNGELPTKKSKLKPPDRVPKAQYNGYSAPAPKYELEIPLSPTRPTYPIPPPPPIPELKGSSTPSPKYEMPLLEIEATIKAVRESDGTLTTKKSTDVLNEMIKELCPTTTPKVTIKIDL